MAGKMKMTVAIAFWICPSLRDEVNALRSGNTKVVLENQRLMDEVAHLKEAIPRAAADLPFSLVAELSKPAQRKIFAGRAHLASGKDN